MASLFRSVLAYVRSHQRILWFLALLVGIVSGYAAIAFVLLLRAVERLAFGSTGPETLPEAIAALPWWHVVLVPTCGGLIVGLALQFLLKRERPFGVVDVIEIRLLRRGRAPLLPALYSAGISILSLGAGGSAGREGPVTHLGGVLAAAFTRAFDLPPRFARVMLGCGVAAAVSASFNAPVAGVLFAHEVVLRHYAPRAIAPIAVASVAGAVISRLHLGDEPAFTGADYALVSYLEMPAFVGLGVIAAIVSMGFLKTIDLADTVAGKITLPLWLRPVLGGALIGAIGIWFPESLGVGYGAVDAALRESYTLPFLLTLIVVKMVASAITLASRFGGGPFSPSLYLGAMAGGAYGLVLGQFFPGDIASYGFYALVGMGAVAAAVLGAPISTTLIVFELTGDYAMTIALLVSASIATTANQTLIGQSFFQWQLRQRGLDVTAGTYTAMLQLILAQDIMRDPARAGLTIEPDAPYVAPDTTLGVILTTLRNHDLDAIAVRDGDGPDSLVGVISTIDALRAYNEALVEAHIEEHQ